MREVDEIVSEFLVESREKLDQLDRDLVGLEKEPSAASLLASIFRTIHTIKGTSGFLAFSKLEAVAHAGENLLSRLRDSNLVLNAAITSTLLDMVDCIRTILMNIQTSGVEGQEEHRDLIDLINGMARATASETVSEIRHTAITSEPESDEHAEHDKPIGQLLIETAGVAPGAVDFARDLQRQGDLRGMAEILVAQGAVTASAAREALELQHDQRAVSTGDISIRVSVALLDKLMNLLGELSLVRSQIVQYSDRERDPAFLNAARRLDLITIELQAWAMKARMQRIGNMWNRLPRIVRDLALARNKQIRLEMEGGEIELDRTLIEAIKDPLTHIVRNSVDHGIELPEQRLAAGKSPEGCISLRAFDENGQVTIEISDDGAGIDLDQVREKALARGLISSDEASFMSDREITDLVFLPGFSTAEKVTNVSGRGVGMDIVKTNLEKIGGAVDLQTRRGEGTTIRIQIPFTHQYVPSFSTAVFLSSDGFVV